jgi:hypothetical protein
MTTYNEQLQRTWRLYEESHGHPAASAREVVIWGVSEGLISLAHRDPYDQLAEDMSRALREEYGTDAKGRRYRVNHAVRVYKNGVQITFWAMMDFAPRSHMAKAFTQRREQIVGDCYQLKVDVDAYNFSHPDQPALPLILDFTHDVEERSQLELSKAA